MNTADKWKYFGTHEAVERARKRDPTYIQQMKGNLMYSINYLN